MENITCYFFCFLVEAVILHQYASTLFISKRKARTIFAVLCAFYFLLFAVSMFASTWLNIVMYLFVNFSFLITQYQVKWRSAFFHAAILTAVMVLCELAVYSIVQHFVPHFFTEEAHFHSRLIFIILSKMIYFTIVYIFTHFLKERPKISGQHEHAALLLVFIPLASCFMMFTLLTVNDMYALSGGMTVAVTLNAVFLVVVNMIVFGMNRYNQKKNAEFTEMQLLLQKEANSAEYYQMLFAQSENQNILIHDIKKHLQSIDLLNKAHEHDKIEAYIRQLMLSSDLKENVRLCSHEMLNTILCRYKRQCDNNRIAFHVDIRHGIIDFIADSDLSSLFGNLLRMPITALLPAGRTGADMALVLKASKRL